MTELFNQIRLLYVEDDENIRPIFERVLRRKMKEVYVACDGLEGYNMYLECKPDLILTDIKMPNMDGLQMAEKIREHDKNIPIIILSAHSESDFFIEAIEIGISGYLVKPIDKEKLFMMLERNVKIALFEKNKIEQEELLQNVIDMQPSIVFLESNNKKMLFTNKLFLDFFDLKDEICDIDDCNIYEHLKEKNSVVIKNVDEDIFWLDYIFENQKEPLEIEITNVQQGKKKFLVNSKHVKRKGDEIAIITLIELF